MNTALFIIFSILFYLILFCLVQSYRYRNPYKLIMVFGKKGSGKTTLLTKLALKHLKKGWYVYTTVPVPGCRLFNVDEIGKSVFPDKSVVFIDEVGMIWDNRNFKNFRFDVRDYFKLQRHYCNKVYLFSQSFDVDKKLRDLTDCMYLCTCHLGFISVAKRIRRTIILTDTIGDSESRIADQLEFVSFLWTLLGAQSRIFTYIPHWTPYFDSHDKPITAYVNYNDIPLITLPTKKERLRKLCIMILSWIIVKMMRSRIYRFLQQKLQH